MFLAATCPSWECFMSVTSSLRRLSLYLVSLSFFNSHPSSRVFFTPYELEIESVSSALARLWSFTGVPVFRFQFVPIKLLELAARFDLASFRKNVVHSSPRPQCLGGYILSRLKCRTYVKWHASNSLDM